MSRAQALPWAALFLTVLIWASYIVSTRAVAETELGPVDIGLLRSGPAALILLPLVIRRGVMPAGASWKDVLFIAGCGGTAFTCLLALGLSFAPAADAGIFTPSMLPAFVALIATLTIGARYRTAQIIGFGLILTGALAVGGGTVILNPAEGAWRGHLLFLFASACWAAYTVRFRVSGLSAIDAAILLLSWSSFAFLVAILFTGTRLTELPPGMLAIQITQGVLAGLVANFTFMYAIRNLGHEIPAAAAALVPIIAAFLGWIALAEPVTGAKWLGIAIVAVGVVRASGILKTR